MAYTEIKKRNGRQYFYRVMSVRKNQKVSKKRIYLGINLSKTSLLFKEKGADELLRAQKKKKQLNALNRLILKIKRILVKNNIKKAGIFGSYVRGEQKKDSDVDILIKPAKGMGLKFFGLQLKLEEKLGRKVDLVSYNAIHPMLKEQILKEEVKII